MEIRKLDGIEIADRKEYYNLLDGIKGGNLEKRKRARQISNYYGLPEEKLKEAIYEGTKVEYNLRLDYIRRGHDTYWHKGHERSCIREAELFVKYCGMDGNKLEKAKKKGNKRSKEKNSLEKMGPVLGECLKAL